jgi:hypothetical protein
VVTATLDGMTESAFCSNDEPLKRNQVAMLADSLDRATRDLMYVTNGILTRVRTR